MGCDSDSIGVGYVILGMGLCVLASVGSTFGLLLQKWAHVQQEGLPDDKKWPESGAAILSPSWILGLVLLVAVPFPLDLVAFTLAPQSLVVPLTGVTLVLNQVFAPFMLDEKVTRLDWIATGVIVTGIVCATAFGSHCSYTYTLSDMIDLFGAPAFVVAESLLAAVLIMLMWWLTKWGAEGCLTGEFEIMRSRSVAYGLLAGLIGGQQQIFLKASGELLETTINGRNEDWTRYESYMIVLACIGFAVAQIMLLNKGLVLWTAVKYLPIYNVALIVSSTTYGSIFYEEYKGIDTLGIAMFSLGVLIVVLGSLLLMLKQEPSRSRSSSIVPVDSDLKPTALEDIPDVTDKGRRDSELERNPMGTEGCVDGPNPDVGEAISKKALPSITPGKQSSGRVSLAPLEKAPMLPPMEDVNASLPCSPEINRGT